MSNTRYNTFGAVTDTNPPFVAPVDRGADEAARLDAAIEALRARRAAWGAPANRGADESLRARCEFLLGVIDAREKRLAECEALMRDIRADAQAAHWHEDIDAALAEKP